MAWLEQQWGGPGGRTGGDGSDMRQHAPWIVAKGLLLTRAGLSPELNPTIVLLQEQSRGVSRQEPEAGLGCSSPPWKQQRPCFSPQPPER